MASRFSAKFSFASKLCRPWLLCVAGCSLRNLVTTSHRTSEQCCSYWFADSDFWRNISNEMCSTSRWRILTSNTKPNLQRDNIFCQCLANCDIWLWLQLILNSRNRFKLRDTTASCGGSACPELYYPWNSYSIDVKDICAGVGRAKSKPHIIEK